MSILDSVNAAMSVVDYDPKTSKASTGFRLSKVQYKTSNDKDSEWYGVKRPSKCVSLKPIAVADVIANAAGLAEIVVGYLHTLQDKIVKERIEAGSSFVTAAEVSIAGIIEWMDTQDSEGSGRLTKEAVSVWFESSIAENLALVLSEKLGVSDTPSDAESAQIMAVVGTFKEKVSALAGGKTSYDAKMATSLKKCIDLAPAGDALASKFQMRLDKMIAQSAGNNLLDLL